jgi:hypothetical protein
MGSAATSRTLEGSGNNPDEDKTMMNGIEQQVAREVRRHLDRRSFDSTQTVVHVSKGVVYVSGQIKALRSEPLLCVKDEVDQFRRLLLRQGTRDYKDVVIDARIIEPPKKDKEHHVEIDPKAPTATAPTTGHHLPGQHH